jgi:hypothetical protein
MKGLSPQLRSTGKKHGCVRLMDLGDGPLALAVAH